MGRSGSALARGILHGIVAACASIYNIAELALDELLAYGRDVVDIEAPLEVVALVLDHTGQEARYFFGVGITVGIGPRQAYVLDAGHVFPQSGEAEASLGAGDTVAVEHLYLGVDELEAASGAFGKAVGERVGVNHHQPYVAAYLWGGEAHAFAGIHGLEHVGHEFAEAGIGGVDGLGDVAEHGVAVEVYR